MGIIKVTKIKAAQRQIDTAVRLLFKNEDPIAIHTIAAAGFQILKDLSKKENAQTWETMNACIRPEMRKKFWGRKGMNKVVNFLKHADEDPNETLDNIDETVNDITLFMACLLYQDLALEWTLEMRAFVIWYTGVYPDHIRDDLPWSTILTEAANDWRGLPRNEQLAFGNKILDVFRQPH